MRPVSPVLTQLASEEKTYTGDGYIPLPAIRTATCVMSRWELSEEERQYLINGGDLFVCQLHGGGGLQPLLPIAAPENEALKIMIEVGTPL